MTRVRAGATLGASEVDALLRPRDGLVAETAADGPGPPRGRRPRGTAPTRSRSGTHRFAMANGPLRAYERTVTVTDAGGGLWAVDQEVSFEVGIPWFSLLFVLPFRRSLGRLAPEDGMPWWAPPGRIDRRGATVLATLCALTVVIGYLDNVLGQTMTYVGAEYHVGTAGQGVALGVVQVSAVLALAALVVADRRGRRGVVLTCAAGAAALTVIGALAPSLAWLTAAQLLAAALVGAMYLLVFVVASEEMPPGSRAWAAGVLSLCYGLGGGAVLLALPLAGVGPGGWRWLYVLAALGVPIIYSCARSLPESRRFAVPAAGSLPRPWRISPRQLSEEHRRRLLILGAASLAYALFATPAGQFTNQYLRVERHFSPVGISVLQQVAGTIGGLGVLVGGRLADTRGRRPVAAVGIAVGTGVTLASFFAHSWVLWAWAIAGSLLSYAVVPALAVFGPELFPTRHRGTATGVITVLGALGGVVGLVLAGILSSAIGTIGPALAVLAAGPLVMVVLIVTAFPEGAGRVLEELNGDAPIGRAAPAGAPPVTP